MQQNHQLFQRLQNGRWSIEEHQRFMYAITQYGKDWKIVESYVLIRSGSQVRAHAQKFFKNLQKLNQRQNGAQKSHQQFSQAEFDIQRQLNNECTPSTPLQLLALIKKQSKEFDGEIDLGTLQKTLEETHERINQKKSKNQMSQSHLRQNSYKIMSKT